MWWRFEALAFPVMASVLMPSFPRYSSFGAWNPSIIYLISPSLGFRSSHAGGQPIGVAFHCLAPTTASPLSPSELPRDLLFWNCLTHSTLWISCVFPLYASFPVALASRAVWCLPPLWFLPSCPCGQTSLVLSPLIVTTSFLQGCHLALQPKVQRS